LEATLSIFTKIFIVLVMLLSVLLASLAVVFVANTDTYRAKFQDEQAMRMIAQGNTAVREADLGVMLQARQDEIDKLKQESTALQSQINTKDGKLQEQQSQIITLQNADADVRGQLAGLRVALQQSQQILGVVETEVKQRRDDMLKLQTRNVELNDALREKITESETLTRQVRLFKEQIADLEGQNEKMSTKLDSLPGGKTAASADTVAPFDHPGAAIRGTVTDVKQIGDETFIAMNVGSNDGVRPGMKFVVHMGDKYLGDAVIMQVDLNSAAGRITLKRGEITPKAEVMTGGL
jgi:predicted  nucleic acid-binding Zn-ribbon protein